MDKIDGIHSHEFKVAAVQRLVAGETVRAVAEALGIRAKLLYRWRERVRDGGFAALHGRRGQPTKADRPPPVSSGVREAMTASRGRIADLESKVGRQQVELDFFRRALRQVRAARRTSAARGAAPSTRSSKG